MVTKVVAVLESMWDWRQMTSGAGYKEAPRSFRINLIDKAAAQVRKLSHA
jgi:hypothetical protein